MYTTVLATHVRRVLHIKILRSVKLNVNPFREIRDGVVCCGMCGGEGCRSANKYVHSYTKTCPSSTFVGYMFNSLGDVSRFLVEGRSVERRGGRRTGNRRRTCVRIYIYTYAGYV